MGMFYLFLSIVCLIFLGVLVELVRKKHLREKYSMLWLFIFLVMIAAFINEPLVTSISLFLGIKYPPTLVFIGATFGLLLLILMLSVIDSHQTDRIIKMSQKIALLEKRIRELEDKDYKK